MRTISRYDVFGPLLCGLLLLTGCTRYQYDLEMAVEEDGQMKRTLTVLGKSPENQGNSPQQLSQEDQHSLEVIYGHPAEILNHADRRFSRTFLEMLPQDIGGAGRIFRRETTLGSVVIYRERFRGSYDFQSMIADRQQAVIRICELMGAWAKQEASDPHAGAEIDEFINTKVKDDLLNLALMLVLLESEDQPGFAHVSTQQGLPRLYQFLIERGYLTDEMIPRLSLRTGFSADEQLSFALQMLDQKRSGSESQSIRDLIPALQDHNTFQNSLNRFLIMTAEYQQLKNNELPSQVLTELYFKIIGFRLQEHDDLEIRLTSNVAPVETNGTWDEEQKRITWKTSLEIPGQPVLKMLPTFCYARWAYPEVEFQRAHFGKIAFSGKRLAEYVDWRMSLTESEGAEWDHFLAGMMPDQSLSSQVNQFEFQSTESSIAVREGLTAQIRSLMSAADDAAPE